TRRLTAEPCGSHGVSQGSGGAEADVPIDRRRRRIDAYGAHADRVAQMAAEGGVQLEQLANLRAQHLRRRLACRLRGAARAAVRAVARRELGDELVQLGAQARSAA